MIRRRLAVALLLAWGASAGTAAAQEPVRLTVREAGPGRLGAIVRDALTRPYTVVMGDTTDLVLPRDSVVPRALVVIGRDVRVSSTVRGDLVVLGGDVFLRPGARIEGDVVAAGGAVYDSWLAVVRGQRFSFRDETLVPTLLADGSYALDHRARPVEEIAMFSLPGIYGLRLPTYDRVNGAALPAGPLITLAEGSIEIEPVVTYRSHLGKLDPSLGGRLAVSRSSRVEVVAARTSRTNDDWINGDFSNSLNAIWSGRDTRNWYRADLLQARLRREMAGPSGSVTPFVGAQWERAWTTGIQAPPRHLAWSVTDREDVEEGMARPNPAVDAGHVASGLAGFDARWEARPRDLELRASGLLEGAPASVGGSEFAQLTLDGRVTFPLTRRIEFRFEWHGVGTLGDAPPQRFAYLGGSGTIKTLDLLSIGGDQLVYFESRASMPVEEVQLPLVGSPTVMIRHMMGAAGEGGLPGFTHNLALRVSLMVVRAEFVVDPINGESDVSVGVSFSR